MESRKQYIPIKINVDDIISKYRPTNIRNFKKDRLTHILNLLTEIPANMERFDELKGFVPMNSNKLKKKIHNYKQYLNYLLNAGVIESDRFYIPGDKSIGYRFTRDFISEVDTTNIHDHVLVNKIQKERQIDPNISYKYNYIGQWINDNLSIDYDQALKHLNEEKEKNIIAQVENIFEKFNYTYMNLDRFNDKDFYYSVDDKVGRFHSNFTNMKSEYRNYIRYGGENLISIDISNSQPYLSTILLDENFYKTTTTFNIHSLNTPKHPSTTSPTTTTSTPLSPPMSPLFKQSDDNQDVRLYKDLVRNGQFYEHMKQVFKEELGITFPDRKAVKEAVFTVLFTSNHFIGQKDAKPKKAFKKLFPTVYKIFAYLKKKDKTFLACLLQRIESYLILDVICKRISNEYPNIPIYTIHDSIATTSGNEKYVEAIMKEELTKHIGMTPKLKFDYWVLES